MAEKTAKRCSFHECEYVGETYRNRCPEHRGVTDTRGGNARYIASLSPEAKRAHYRRGNLARFNITPDEYAAQEEAQGFLCAICARPETVEGRRLAVDHDHSCCPEPGRSCGKCLRGLLCSDCNGALGLFADDPARILNALTYLSAGGVW